MSTGMNTSSGERNAPPEPRAELTVGITGSTGPHQTPPDEPPPLPLAPRWMIESQNRTLILNRRRLRVTLRYWCTGGHLPLAIGWGTWRCLCTVVGEVRPIAAGAGKIADGLYAWGAALDHENAAKVAVGTPHAYRGAERYVNAKIGHRRILVSGAVGLTGIGTWLVVYYPTAGVLALIVLVVILDLIGRHGRVQTDAPTPRPRPLVEGMPTHLLRQEIRIILDEEGYTDMITVSDVELDVVRQEYRVWIVTHTEIKPELLRQIERRINAPARAIHVVQDEENSAEMCWVIRLRNPLANVPEAPWITAGERSAWGPLDLGVALGDQPFALVFARVHVVVIARNGGGKTKVHLCNIIDRLSACRDAVIFGIDLQNGPTFPMWRSVIQQTAYTVDEADNLLDLLLAEMDNRAGILRAIAEDDDPTNDTDEWVPALGPAIVTIIDEFPQLSKWDGTKLDLNGDKPNLLAKVETIYRLGRKFGISLVIGIQKTGNADTGSTVVSSQSHVWIVGPCEEADTVNVFGKAKRDAGYTPHLFKAATPESHHDAGMAVVDAPGFGPDPVRGYRPFSVKPRAMRREAEWRELGNKPVLTDDGDQTLSYINVTTVPPALAAVDAALTHYQTDVLGTALVIEHANAHGGNWTAAGLAKTLNNEAGPSPHPKGWSRGGRCRVQRKSVQCYFRADIDEALRRTESRS